MTTRFSADQGAEAQVEREVEVPRDGAYRVVLQRLQRLVRYRRQLLDALGADAGDQKAASELVRVRHMIRQVHRAVSMNVDAAVLAQRIDPEAGAAPARPVLAV